MNTDLPPVSVPSGISERSEAAARALNGMLLSAWVIFSAPTTRARRHAPASRPVRASRKADEPLAQAFSTLKTGLPSRPVPRSAVWPRMASWPVVIPATELEKKMTSMSSAVRPASFRAAPAASSASERRGRSRKRPNGAIPTPRITMCGAMTSDYTDTSDESKRRASKGGGVSGSVASREAYNPAIEHLDGPGQRTLQWTLLQQQLERLWHTNPFYRRRLEGAGASPERITSLEAFRELVPMCT